MFKYILILALLNYNLANTQNAQVDFNLQLQQIPPTYNTPIKEEVIMAKPKIITEQIMQKPKIITERVTNPPRVVTDQVVEPTRQRIVIQPRINKVVETLKPQYDVQPDTVQNPNPITQATKYQYESRTQVENVPGDVVNNNYYVEPTVKTIRQNVQFQPAQEIHKNLNPIHRTPDVQNNTKTLNYVIPADQYINQPYVQPIHQKENVEVKWLQEGDNITNLDPITRQPIYQNRNRVQNVSVPGNVYYKQNVTQPTINREEVEVRFNQAPNNYSTNNPILKPTVNSYDKKVIRNIVPYTVRDEIPVAVPQPVAYDVPVYQYQYVPVQEPHDDCCHDDPLGGIESIVNSSEVVINNGNGDIVLDDKGRRKQDYRDRRNQGGRREVGFEEAVRNLKGVYGDDTFSGDLRYFDFERREGRSLDPNVAKLKRKVLREKDRIVAEEKEQRRLAYLNQVYGSRCKRYNSAYGYEKEDEPIFQKERYYFDDMKKMNSNKHKKYYDDCY